MPKVSIIMPVYNKADYLRETFQAVLSQSYQDWELIVVDDGSTDESAERIKEWAQRDQRIFCIRQNNRGAAAARNTGMHKASGEWIWFVDADDLPDQNFLQNVFSKAYGENDGTDVIAGNYQCLEKNGEIKEIVLEEQGKVLPEKFPDLFMKYQYRTGYWGYLWNKLIRRQMLKETQIRFQEGLTLAEDLKVMTAIYRKGAKVLLVPYMTMRYTVDAVNGSKEKKTDYLAQLAIQMEIKEWIVDQYRRDRYVKQFQWRISRYAAFVVFYAFEEQEDFIERAKRLAENPEISSQLRTDHIEAVMRPIVWCLMGRRYQLLKWYLYSRKEIKKLAGRKKDGADISL